ncbi:MAG: hypothetical protein KGH84_12575, partial [Paracoccaceae bacterium]|nr:hypothetical protein [Paracoccaceae bacterium]
MEILVVTRFSFHGQSGWKSEFSTDPEKLFERERLEARLLLMRVINLSSLKAQTNQNFHHYILTSADLPEWALNGLTEACIATYGSPDRFSIRAEPFGKARARLARFLVERYGAEPVAQVVLDDDDGLSAAFMADLAERLTRIEGDVAKGERTLPYFISYPNGLGVTFDETGVALYRHRYEFINLGLTMISRPREKNVFSIDHQSTPKRFGCEVVETELMFLRSVHGFNDSRVGVTRRWVR